MTNLYSGANLDNVKEINYSAVLNTIYRENGISRIDLAAQTEMSCAFVTKVLTKLTVNGIILEEKRITSERGRPKIALKFNCDKYSMLGLRINGKYLSSCICDANGKLLCHYIGEIHDLKNGEEIYSECVNLLKKAMEHNGDRNILGIGIAAPGPLPLENDRITALTNKPFEDFSDIKITERIESDFGMPVHLIHDAHCGALNEYIFCNENKRYSSIVFIATDNGVGAGIIIDGKPYNGSGGLAGEIEKMIICFDSDFKTLGHLLSPNRLISQCGCRNLEEVLQKVMENDPLCCECFDRFIRYLTIAYINFITTLSPQAVVISDKIALLRERVERICKETTEKLLPEQYRDSFDLIIRPYSKHSVLRGACGAVLNAALERPCKYFPL